MAKQSYKGNEVYRNDDIFPPCALLIVLRKLLPRCRFRHRICKLPLDLTTHTQS